MATSPDHCRNTHEYIHNWEVRGLLGCTESSGVTWDTPDMEVKGHLISAPDVLCGSQDGGKQCVERMTALQERRRSLQTLLNSRLAELRRVCLQEAELTGEIPGEFPLEAGERRPYVRRRVASYRHGPKAVVKTEVEEVCQRKPKKTLFSSALRRHVDSEQHHTHSKRTVHRGCHTDDSVNSESSSMSDSTGGHDNDESSGGAPDCLSPARPRTVPGRGNGSSSPDSRLCRKLSPIEVYYEIRTTARRNSLTNTASPSRTLPRSISNVEGRSVPATPLLTRNGPPGVHNHTRSDVSSGMTTRQWSDSSDGARVVPLQSQDGPPAGPSYSTQRRSSSSEALLDRTTSCEEGGKGRGGQGERSGGMPSRAGPPYKSSDALTDGRPRQLNGPRSSPERQPLNGHGGEQNRLVGPAPGGPGGRGGVYSEVLMDYVWGRQQRQAQQVHGKFPSSVPAPPPSHFNGYPHPQGHLPGPQQLSGGPPAYSSPLMLRGKPGEPRRVKVTRTKSCGPFIPLQQHQQEALLFSAYTSSGDAPQISPTAAVHPQHGSGVESNQHQVGSGSGPVPQLSQNHRLGPPQYSDTASPDDPTRSLHKALALEGLRAWYLRNTLTSVAGAGQGQDNGAPPRRRTTNSLHGSHPHQPLAHQGDWDHPPCQLPQSQTFHGHPVHGRWVAAPGLRTAGRCVDCDPGL
uniref:Cytohesin Ubiquitin Protein Inducing domain-containing protein n=1 Tax=Esox lucius TaxID=8010 RepID=A0A3P8YTR6_ESOLU